MILKKIGWIVSFEVEIFFKVEKQCSLLNYAFVKKPKKHPLKWKFLNKKKTWRPRFLEFAERHVNRFKKKKVLRVFFGFFEEGTPYFDCIKADDFRLYLAVNWYKTPKNQIFHDFFVSFCLTKKMCVGSWLQKLFIPFTWNIKNIPSGYQSSTLYLKLSLIQFKKGTKL